MFGAAPTRLASATNRVSAAYARPLDRAVIYSLLSNLWDRGEASGYAQYMTRRPLPDTPPHEVLLHVALGDHQVAPVTADVMARTIGANVWNNLDSGRSTDEEPFFGIPALTRFPYRAQLWSCSTPARSRPRTLRARRSRRRATCRRPRGRTRTSSRAARRRPAR